ncbi:MAG: flippase [Methanobacterium sp.]|jgi:O-antigen/teichoic acid export membrane protein
MSIVKLISKNIASLATIEVVNQICLVILALLIPLYLGDVGFGQYSLVVSFTTLFMFLLDPGLRSLTIREVSREKVKKNIYLNNLTTIKLILSSFTILFMIILVNVMQYPQLVKTAMYIMLSAWILNSFSDVFRSIFYAFQKMEYGTLTLTAAKIVTTLLASIFLFFGYGLVEVVLAFFIGNFLALLINFLIYTKKFQVPKFKIDLEFSKKILVMSFPFGLAIAFNNVFFNFDIVVIDHIMGDAAAGWYSIPKFIIMILITFFFTVPYALFPTFSKFYKDSMEKLNYSYEKIFKFLLILTLPTSTILFMLASDIILFLFQYSFTNSIFIFQALIWLVIPISLARFLEIVLASINKQKLVTYNIGIFALSNIILDILLIPYFGINGAIIATTLSQIAIFIFDLFFVSKYLCKISVYRLVLKPAISCMFIGILIYFLINFVNFIILGCISIVFYIFILAVLGGFDKEDINMIKKIITRSD